METGIVKTQENLNESQQGKRKKEQIQSLEEDELKKKQKKEAEEKDWFEIARKKLWDEEQFPFFLTHPYFVTVPPGCEEIASLEIKEKINPTMLNFQVGSGRVRFSTSIKIKEIISQLKCAEHLYAFVKEESNIPIQKSGLQQIKKCTAKIDWRAPAMLWRIAYLPDDTPDKLNVIPNFRVVGKRNGDQHFNSLDMAGYVGGGLLQCQKNWKVSLTDYNMEVYADLDYNTLTLGIRLSQNPLYSRENGLGNVKISIKPNVAHCIARLASIKPGETVVDPLIAESSLLYECTQVSPQAKYQGGDHEDSFLEQARTIFSQVPNVSIFKWDLRNLPLNTGSVDVIITDLPFARRSNIVKSHERSYSFIFREITRVIKIQGRAIILTLEKGLIKKILEKNDYWKEISSHSIFTSGFQHTLYILERTEKTFKGEK